MHDPSLIMPKPGSTCGHENVFPDVELVDSSRLLLEHLQARKQLVHVRLAVEGTIWLSLADQLEAHLSRHNLHLTPQPGVEFNLVACDQLPFRLLNVSQRASSDPPVHRLTIASISSRDFTLRKVLKKGAYANTLRESDPLSEFPVIFVGEYRFCFCHLLLTSPV